MGRPYVSIKIIKSAKPTGKNNFQNGTLKIRSLLKIDNFSKAYKGAL